MQPRAYDAERDLAAVEQIWRECGWVDEDEAAHLPDFLADGHTVVADVDGHAEASCVVHDGELTHTGHELPLAAVTAVTTSRLGRKQGLARAVLDDNLRAATARGNAVSILGMFEQGFYDLSGFGTGSEMLLLRIDPANLAADLPYRRPVRLTLDDTEDIVNCLLARRRTHGAVTLPSVAQRRAERSWDDNGFGLGYRDGDGTLTHFVWCDAKGEYGPYSVREWAWRTTEELLELLGILRSLGDQVRTIVIPEPADLQLRVLVDQPGRTGLTRTTGDHRHEVKASAWWQARILDVPRCLALLSTRDELHCNLRVSDPLHLDAVAGEWVLHLGPTTTVERGHEEDLPTMMLSVNALTRWWLGVRPLATLQATDGIEASPDLVARLDDLVRLPRPDVQTDF